MHKSITGKINWLYWVDIKKWDNALVIQDEGNEISRQLSYFFKNVEQVNVIAEADFLSVYETLTRQKRYDLILFTHSFLCSIQDAQFASRILKCTCMGLSSDGHVVIEYQKMTNWFFSLIFRTLGGNIEPRLTSTKKGCKPDVIMNLLNRDPSFLIQDTLFVFPSVSQPLKNSNSDVFFKQITDWKKKTKKNQLLLWFVGAQLTYRFSKLWWPSRILIVGRKYAV